MSGIINVVKRVPSRVKQWQFSTAAQLTRQNSNGPVFIHTYPGSRVFELCASSTGNLISANLVSKISRKLSHMTENVTVAAIIFQAYSSGEIFSLGVDKDEYEKDRTACIKNLQKLATDIRKLEKATVGVFSGHSNGTGFGVFSGSKYRLGSESTTLAIDELKKGMLPVGGLAYHMTRNSKDGVEYARFLGVGDITLGCFELHSIGCITHIVEEDPHDSFADALANTISKRESKYEITEHVDEEAIEDLLETMHISSDLDREFDVMASPIWDEALLVRPVNLDSSDPTQTGSWEEIQGAIKHCFSPDSPEESLKRLKANVTNNEIIAQTAEHMAKLDPAVVAAWYKLTRYSSTASLENALKAELTASTSL